MMNFFQAAVFVLPLVAHGASQGARLSSGCHTQLIPTDTTIHEGLHWRQAAGTDLQPTSHWNLSHWRINVSDFNGPVRRNFIVAKPDARAAISPAPLLVAIHGQTGRAGDMSMNNLGGFGYAAYEQGLITVYPQGLDDADPHTTDEGTGWNVGTAGDNHTCLDTTYGVGDSASCYKSCEARKKCGRCNWSTCYDDVGFVKRVIEFMGSYFCIDLDKVFAYGESNGGMFVHHLVDELPDTFAAVVPVYAIPLLGHLNHGASSLTAPAFMQLHGRFDQTIPPAGGIASNWIYEPLETVQNHWARIHKCSSSLTDVITPWDGGEKNFRCAEHAGCRSGKRVMRCFYNGDHGDQLAANLWVDLVVRFFLVFSNNSFPVSGDGIFKDASATVHV